MVGEYGIGVIFVPLNQGEELSMLFVEVSGSVDEGEFCVSVGSFGNFENTITAGASLDDEIIPRVSTESMVEEDLIILMEETAHGVQDMSV